MFLGNKIEFRPEKYDLNNERHYEELRNLFLEHDNERI